jgi:uncharacterized membrane protein YoaK (UPF0700 family)
MTDATTAATSDSIHGQPQLLPVALAFTAGFVDTLGFLALFFFFTAHVTGNFVVLGAALVQPLHGLIAKVLALPMFIATVAGARLYILTLERHRTPVAARLLAVEAAFLLAFLALGAEASPITDGDSPLAIATALSGVVAMGVQNAASRTVFAALSPTTVMTGNVTQLVIDAVDLLVGPTPANSAVARARIQRFWPPVVAFGAGAAAGAIGYSKGGFWCLLVPTVLLLLLAIRASRNTAK